MSVAILTEAKVKAPRKSITHTELDRLELRAHLIRSVERYAYVRQWLSGRVIDFGCGTGYGSYMISQNPDVVCVIGFDIDKPSIDFAQREYQDEKLYYNRGDVAQFDETAFDWIVAVEVIEHLRQPEQLAILADKANAAQILLTYPNKKTTHYNPFHIRDYDDEMIAGIFPKFQIYHSCDFHATHDTKILFLKRTK